MAPMKRAASAPLHVRSSSRYSSSVLESALVGLGRDDVVVRSTRKPRKKWRNEPLEKAVSAPVSMVVATEEEDPFAHMKLLKKKKNVMESPAITFSKFKSKKQRSEAGVLEMVGRTPVTRSMNKKRRIRSSLEYVVVKEDAVVVQKQLLFQSPVKKKKEEEKKEVARPKNRRSVLLTQWRVQWPPLGDEQRAMLVLTGQVDGEPASFEVAKREGPTKFTSAEGGYVALSGKFDRDAARSAGIPRAVMDMMQDGIPAYFNKRLLPFVSTRKAVKVKESGLKRKQVKKPSRTKQSSSRTDEDGDTEFEAPISSLQDTDVHEKQKPKRARAPAPVKERKKRVKKKQPEPETEEDVWTAEQVEALSDAKLKIPTVASNFWAQVAQFVPGKSAKDCQTKTFERFRSPPTNRKGAKKSIKRTNTEADATAKIARAGSNKFKKQVREFVEEYEKKHVDDIFDTTPSKEGLPELPEFDSIKSPELATPSRSFAEDDSDDEDEAPGLLKKLSSRRRDDIDSYVLGLNRQHVAGGGVMAGGKVRRVTAMATPMSTAKGKTKPTQKKAVMLKTECGSHSLKGIVSPGGTTHIRVEKDGSSSEEDEDDCHSSEEEEDFDLPDQ